MLVADYHVHTARCGHAGGACRDYVHAAIAKGLDVICFTDHVPVYFLPGEDPDPGAAMAKSELPGYVEEVLSLREEFRGRIDVLLGLEADYAEGHEAELQALLAPYPWDAVIGSVHWVSGGWIDGPDAPARFEREGVAALWTEYYRLYAKAALSGLFDFLGHMDLPKKFGNRMPASCASAEEAALEAAAAAGLAVEVSSAGLRKKAAEIYPGPSLLARLVAAGVPLVLTADAHAPAEVAWGRPEVLSAALAAGAARHRTFRGRRPVDHPLTGPRPTEKTRVP